MRSRSELRLVTCLFIDVVGSTDLGRRVGPERMRQALDEAFSEISGIATAEGGTVEKYIGDEVFVLFGVPSSHADDAARALRVAEGSVRWAADRGIGIRAGVETGEALVDLDAIAERQRMAVGTCVNVAARLQQEAEPGQVVVGPTCRAAAADAAEFVDLGTRELKGLGAVRVHRLIRATAPARAELPFVGRNAELARLRSSFDRARGGRATLALLIGPPGIGKSRLLAEFVDRVGDEALVLRARLRPGTETGVSPLREVLADADPMTLPAGVAHSAGIRLDPRLLALPVGDRRNEITLAWRDYLAERAGEDVVLVSVEDLHWAESELVRLLDRLTFDADLRLMIAGTARPEFPGMPLVREAEDRLVMEITPLERKAALELGRAAGARDTDVVRAEGHPLFIVELARGAASAASLPVTVQAAIGARLDELAPADREMLQIAGVIGETFDARGVALLGEREPAEIVGALARLTHLRYLDPVDGRYRFHHALVHEVAYSRLPAKPRLRLHARYAREGLRREDVETAAHHWWRALGDADAQWVWEGDPELELMRSAALEAHLAAGAGLADRSALDRATDVFTRAGDLARSPRERARVEEAKAVAAQRHALGDDAVEHRLKAVALYREGGLEPPAHLYADVLDLIAFNWGYFKRLPAFDEVMRLLDEGIRIARAAGDQVSLLRLLVQRGIFVRDVTVLAEADELLDRAPDLRSHADSLWRMALVHFTVSKDIARALEACDRAFALGERGAHFNRPEALMWRSSAHFHAGDLDAAEADADELIAASERLSPHTRQHGIGAKGRVLFARGDWDGVRASGEELRALVRESTDATFCLVGATLAGYAAVADVICGGTLPEDLDALAVRLLPERPTTRAAAVFLARALGGAEANEAEALRAYQADTPIWHLGQVWDVASAHLALAYVATARWSDAEQLLGELDAIGSRGGAFASALASAMREEIAGGARTHRELRDLGYHGISEVLAYRVDRRLAATNIEP
jgi:class 3 adenylate cyclase/tetratricopeptide (TPR) repeat protein